MERWLGRSTRRQASGPLAPLLRVIVTFCGVPFVLLLVMAFALGWPWRWWLLEAGLVPCVLVVSLLWPRQCGERGTSAAGSRSRSPALGCLFLLAAASLPSSYARADERREAPSVYSIWGDPRAGSKVFAAKGCGGCHAVAGSGPSTGPDLGARECPPRGLTEVGALMWNHAPEMREQARRSGRPWEPFRDSEMRDLVAFLYFLQMQDPPGDSARGERLFDEKRCSTCHALGGEGSAIGPDLARWKHLASPVLWAEAMWKHATQMEETMHEMKLSWPTFAEGEMVDLIAFIRKEAGRSEGRGEDSAMEDGGR